MSTVESIRGPGATLADRVYQQVTDEDRGIVNVSPLPWPSTGRPDGFESTDEQLDRRDWGLVLGVAFTLARVDDPFASDSEIGTRAYLAANEAWERWSDPDGDEAS